MCLPILHIKLECWKFNKTYSIWVSNMGHFRNQYKKDIPVMISKDGYCYIKTERGSRKAHRLVMNTWKPTPDADNLTVDHLDHNKRNNALSNLEWVSDKENQARAKRDFIPMEKANADKYKLDMIVEVEGIQMSVQDLLTLYKATASKFRENNFKNWIINQSKKIGSWNIRYPNTNNNQKFFF